MQFHERTVTVTNHSDDVNRVPLCRWSFVWLTTDAHFTEWFSLVDLQPRVVYCYISFIIDLRIAKNLKMKAK